MGVEGMWAIYFGDADAPGEVPNSGVIVLETGKVFGGDSIVAYVGGYSVTGSQIEANARTFTYNPNQIEIVSAFGRQGHFDVMTTLRGTVSDDKRSIVGSVSEQANPDAQLPFVMHRIADLP